MSRKNVNTTVANLASVQLEVDPWGRRGADYRPARQTGAGLGWGWRKEGIEISAEFELNIYHCVDGCILIGTPFYGHEEVVRVGGAFDLQIKLSMEIHLCDPQ